VRRAALLCAAAGALATCLRCIVHHYTISTAVQPEYLPACAAWEQGGRGNGGGTLFDWPLKLGLSESV
jgi:hypothetical protein